MKVFETELEFLANDTGISIYRNSSNACRWLDIYWVDSSEVNKVVGLKESARTKRSWDCWHHDTG